jgi:hypothetical protein
MPAFKDTLGQDWIRLPNPYQREGNTGDWRRFSDRQQQTQRMLPRRLAKKAIWIFFVPSTAKNRREFFDFIGKGRVAAR